MDELDLDEIQAQINDLETENDQGTQNDIFDDDEEEIELTAAEVLKLMEEAWLNEKFAPEILPNKTQVVECLLDQINIMEEQVQQLDSSDFKKSLHLMEVDRLRYIVSSYLRCRLEKIELYCLHIIKEENARIEKGEIPYLTDNEFKFAKEYRHGLEHHFESITGTYHNSAPKNDWKDAPIEPNLNTFVFLKSKVDVDGIIIDEGTNENNDLVDLEKDSQCIISYNSVSNLIKNGDAHLI